MRQLFNGSVRIGMTASGQPYTITNTMPGLFETRAPGTAAAMPHQDSFQSFREALAALRATMVARGDETTRKLIFVPAAASVQESEIELFDATIEITPDLLANLEQLLLLQEQFGLALIRQNVTNLYWDGTIHDAKFDHHHLVLADKVQWASGCNSVDGDWEGITRPLTVQEVAEALNAEEREVFFCDPENIQFICNSHFLAIDDLPPAVFGLPDCLSQLRAILDVVDARKQGRAPAPRNLEEKVGMMMEAWQRADSNYSSTGWRVIGRDLTGQMFGLMHGKIVRVDPNLPTYSPCTPDEVRDVETGLANGYIEFGVWEKYVSSRHQEQPLLVLYPATRHCVPWDYQFRIPA